MARSPSPLIPSDLCARLEAARLDTLALIRAIDQTFLPPSLLPLVELRQLSELDADCAEALWALLDQPPGSLDFKAMLRDTLASLKCLPDARNLVRRRISTSHQNLASMENTVRAALDLREAYNDIPQIR